MNTDTPLNTPQPDTADIDAALERQAQYTRKLHAEVQRTIPAEKPTAADIDAALTRTHAKLEFARLERQELADIRKQRDHYKAHAAQLAEALRDIMAEFAESDNDAPHLKVWKQAKQALAAYKSEVRQ